MGNIALNKPAASSTYVKPYSAANAVNGTTTPLSRWLCNTLPGWISVNTGAKYLVNRWVVRHLPVAGWQSTNYAIREFRLQGSNDNSAWYDIDFVVENTSNITDRTIAVPVIYQFFRVYVTKGLNCNLNLASILELEIYQAFSNLLTGLAISSGILAPAFSPNTLNYTATVDSTVASINVTPTAQDPQAVIKVNGTIVASGQALSVPLAYGSNTITVNVTDGTGAQRNYTILVTRPSVFLSMITVQSGSTTIPLTPSPFVKTTVAYSASVDYDTNPITVIPTADKTGSTITVNGTEVASGTASGPISLNVGSNQIIVAVTLDGVTQNYTLTLSRADSACLSALTAQSGTVPIPLMPSPFVETTMAYSASVGFEINSFTITPTAEYTGASIKVNNEPTLSGQPSASIPLPIGTTTILVEVTAPSGTKLTYSVAITRINSCLSGMTVKSGLTNYQLAPLFQSALFSYATTAPNKSNVNLTLIVPLTTSAIKVNGTPFTSGVATSVLLQSNINVFTITVTNSGVTTTYLLTINK